MVRYLMIPVWLLFFSLPAQAGTISIEAQRDNTLIEDPEGALSNGAGPHLFVGHTNQMEFGVRRGLLYFDVAAALPRKAIIERAALTLNVSTGQDGISEIRLHRMLDDWGEGASFKQGGQGAPAEPGDVTWIHTFYDDSFWVKDGGHFLRRASASQPVETPGFYTWESTVHLVQDVTLWLRVPERNFGWVLLGDETVFGSVKRFDSRESQEPNVRPLLEVTYRLPGNH